MFSKGDNSEGVTLNKFPIGSQWKTRAGHRAVVVKRYDDQTGFDGCFKTWEENLGLCFHFKDGRSNYELNRGHDLVAPWTEPRKGAFFINVYDDRELAVKYETREAADYYKRDGRLACVRVDWTEGDGI